MERFRDIHGLYWVKSSGWSQFNFYMQGGNNTLPGGIQIILRGLLALDRLSRSRLLHTARLHQHRLITSRSTGVAE